MVQVLHGQSMCSFFIILYSLFIIPNLWNCRIYMITYKLYFLLHYKCNAVNVNDVLFIFLDFQVQRSGSEGSCGQDV